MKTGGAQPAPKARHKTHWSFRPWADPGPGKNSCKPGAAGPPPGQVGLTDDVEGPGNGAVGDKMVPMVAGKFGGEKKGVPLFSGVNVSSGPLCNNGTF